MSDYKRTHEALTLALFETRHDDTVGDAAHRMTPVVLELLADEVGYWAERLQTPPVAAEWPLTDATPELRGAYLAGWKAAAEVLAARAGALRLAERSDDDPQPSVEQLREILKGVADTPA